MEPIWKLLEEKERAPRTYLKQLVFKEAASRMYVGIDSDTGNRLCLVHIPKKSLPKPMHFLKMHGLKVMVELLGDEENENISLIFIVVQNDFTDLFSSFANSLFERLLQEPDRMAWLGVAQEEIRRWQKFFEEETIRGMRKDSRQGLFGELYFLRRYLFPHVAPYDAVIAWRGSEGASHDVATSIFSAEVKTTAKRHDHVFISSENQLDKLDETPLYLAHLQLEVEGSRGETLLEVIDSIRTLLLRDPTARALFEHKLHSYGYSDVQKSLYASTRYQVRSRNLYRVDEGFPRITSNNIPQGVLHVSYNLSTSSIERFKCEEEELFTLFERMLHQWSFMELFLFTTRKT